MAELHGGLEARAALEAGEDPAVTAHRLQVVQSATDEELRLSLENRRLTVLGLALETELVTEMQRRGLPVPPREAKDGKR